MKKHKEIAKDKELLTTIYKLVNKEVLENKKNIKYHLLIKLLFYLTLVFLFYLFLFNTYNIFLFILSYIGYGICAILLALNFAHDFSHNTIFRSKSLNNLCYSCIYTILGAHAEAWKSRHVNAHHFAPNVEDYDSDLKITKLIRLTPYAEHFWFHKFQHIYAPIAYMSYSLFWVFIKDFVILFSKDEFNEGKDLSYHISFWIQKIFYICFLFIFPLFYSVQSWKIVVMGFLIMHICQSLFLLFTFLMTHHVEGTFYPTKNEKGIINTSWVMNQIRSSNDIYPFSQIANFIFGGFNNHIAHHLFPHVHHIYYPTINRILYPILRENDIKPNKSTYWGGIISHLRILKRRGRGNI